MGVTGEVFDIQHYSISDGPGIRTTVFLKGCPLACLWCSNPESQASTPQLFHLGSLCTGCGRCVEVCPSGASRRTGSGSIGVDRSACTACGRCVEACPAGARALSGRTMAVEEVVEEVKKDALFYRNSHGGVTISGGEPTLQPVFAQALLRRCGELGIHTALQTCGHAPWETFWRVAEHADLVLFDVKHLDAVRHERLTGVRNDSILGNLERLSHTEHPVVVRFPLIPGCNDGTENVVATGWLLKRLGYLDVELVPYHRLGTAKYGNLGRTYKLEALAPYDQERLIALGKLLFDLGLRVRIV